MGEAVSSKFNQYVEYTARAPWKLAVKPFRVAPDIFFIGNEWVGSYLISTEEGLIMVDTCLFENLYLTLESIHELGFDPKNIRHILLSHCHADHVGGAGAIHELTGAKIWMSRIDAGFKDNPANTEMDDVFYVPPYRVDAFYDDEVPMRFGSIEIRTCLTPGHTPGTTSFLISGPDESGKILTAGMHGGVGPLTMREEYIKKYGLPENLRQQFVEGCEELKKINVDITLPSHPAHGELLSKRPSDPDDYHPFVNKDNWGAFLESRIGFIREPGRD